MKKFIKNNLSFITLLIFCAFCLCKFCTAQVVGSSMNPTYTSGDFLLVWKTEDVKLGDIVAINSDTLGKILCKRVIGVAGDHIVINETGLYINNELIVEEYTSTEDWYINYNLDITVPEDSVFVMGDNRIASTDSRAIGCIEKSNLIGISILNITKELNFTRKDFEVILVLCWIFFFIFLIFCKIKSRKKEG